MFMTRRLENILKLNQLSVAEKKKIIMGLFLGSPGALSHNDIEKKACMEDAGIPTVSLPKGFTSEPIETLASGVRGLLQE